MIVTDDTTVLFANDQVAAMTDPSFKGVDIVGKKWPEYMPAAWCVEWLPVVRHVATVGKPLIKRGIWRGTQYFTALRPIPGGDRQNDPDTRVLVISRAVPTSEQEHYISQARQAGMSELLDAEGVHLGPLDVLSARELEVFALVGAGLSIEETARALHRSPDTIKSHRKSIAEKLGTSDRVTLQRMADRAGLQITDAGSKRLHENASAPRPSGV